MVPQTGVGDYWMWRASHTPDVADARSHANGKLGSEAPARRSPVYMLPETGVQDQWTCRERNETHNILRRHACSWRSAAQSPSTRVFTQSSEGFRSQPLGDRLTKHFELAPDVCFSAQRWPTPLAVCIQVPAAPISARVWSQQQPARVQSETRTILFQVACWHSNRAHWLSVSNAISIYHRGPLSYSIAAQMLKNEDVPLSTAVLHCIQRTYSTWTTSQILQGSSAM